MAKKSDKQNRLDSKKLLYKTSIFEIWKNLTTTKFYNMKLLLTPIPVSMKIDIN